MVYPQGFQPLPKGAANGEVISALPAAPEEVEDLSEFKFAKFAATFFQGNVGPQYSRKALKQSLLPLQTQGDQLVSDVTCKTDGAGSGEVRARERERE